MAEKRDIKRQRRRLAVRFGINGPDRLAYTEDVSEHGLFIKTTNLCPPGTRITISLTMPDEQVVQILGSVRWTKKVPLNMIHLVHKSGMGVKIIKFHSGEAIYQAFIAELLARY